MPRDSNGNTVPLPGTIVSTGDTILPSQHNPMVNDVYAMMTQSLSRDGQGGMRSTLDMSGFRIINVGSATQPTDVVSLGQLQNGTPVGSVVDYAGSSAPPTWMLCYGEAVSRTAYAALFSAIGTTFGVGDGSTTFNLPDCRGRVIAARDDMGGADAGRLTFFGSAAKLLGGVFGSASHILTIGQVPKHNHGGNTGANGGHDHVMSLFNRRGADGNAGSNSGWDAGDVQLSANVEKRTSSVPNHTHTLLEQGNDEAHTNAQPTIIMNKIIKVSY